MKRNTMTLGGVAGFTGGLAGVAGITGVIVLAFTLLLNATLDAAALPAGGSAPQVMQGGFAPRSGSAEVYTQPEAVKVAPMRVTVAQP